MALNPLGQSALSEQEPITGTLRLNTADNTIDVEASLTDAKIPKHPFQHIMQFAGNVIKSLNALFSESTDRGERQSVLRSH